MEIFRFEFHRTNAVPLVPMACWRTDRRAQTAHAHAFADHTSTVRQLGGIQRPPPGSDACVMLMSFLLERGTLEGRCKRNKSHILKALAKELSLLFQRVILGQK